MASLRAVVGCAREIFSAPDRLRPEQLGALAALMDRLAPADFCLEVPAAAEALAAVPPATSSRPSTTLPPRMPANNPCRRPNRCRAQEPPPPGKLMPIGYQHVGDCDGACR